MTIANRPRTLRLAKESTWIIMGQLASVLGTLILVKILTERLEPTQYGQLALALTVAGLITQVVMGGISNGITRYYSIASEQSDLPGYLHASRQMMLYATGAVFAIGSILLFGLKWLDYSLWIKLVVAVLVFSLLNGYNNSLNGIQNAARQRSIVAVHQGGNAWLKILFAGGMMYWLGNSSIAVVIGYAISSLLVISSQYVFLKRTISCKITANKKNHWVRHIWEYSWPFSLWGGFTWMQQSSDRWALDIFVSRQDVGFYTVLFQLGYTPIVMATGMAVTFLGPVLFQRAGDASSHSRNTNVHQLVWRITTFCLLLTVIGFLLTFKLHTWIFQILVAENYREISYLLPWVLLAGGLFGAGQMLTLKLMSEMKTMALIWVKITTALIGVLFNFYGASIAGLQGIVGALIAFSTIYLSWIIWLAFRIPQKTTPTKRRSEEFKRG